MSLRRLFLRYQAELISGFCILGVIIIWTSIARSEIHEEGPHPPETQPGAQGPALQEQDPHKQVEHKEPGVKEPEPAVEEPGDQRPRFPDLRFRALRIPAQLLDYVDDLPILNIPQCTTKVKDVLYVKTHKAASETTITMMRRFGLNNNLSFALPVGFMRSTNNFGWPWPFKKEYVYPSLSGKFNILCDLSVFSPEVQLPLLHSDAMVVASIREPFDHTRSAFYYYDFHDIKWKNQDLAFEEFLYDLQGFDDLFTHSAHGCIPRGVSMARNGQARDFGFPLGFQEDPDRSLDQEYIRSFLKRLSETVHLPMITEHHDESLILLRRSMCWQWKDIIYQERIPNIFKLYNKKTTYNEALVENARNWNHLDSLIYRLMNKTLWTRVKQLGEHDFMEELAAFKQVRYRIMYLCVNEERAYMRNMNNFEVIEHFPPNQWDAGFDLRYRDCYMINNPLRVEVRKYFDDNPFMFYDKDARHVSYNVPGC